MIRGLLRARLVFCILLIPLIVALRMNAGDIHDKPECSQTHFIHVGKTGGTTVFKWLHQAYPELKQVSKDHKDYFHNLVFHGHDFLLGQGKPEDCYVFFVRDPVERWVSGFLSKYRQGCPSYCSKRAPGDEQFLAQFPTPNALAEALASNDTSLREKALQTHRHFFHTNNGFEHYLPHLSEFMSRIIFVGQTLKLSDDFENMLRACDMPKWQQIDYETQNGNPHELHYLEELSPEGHAAVKELIAPDFQIIDQLIQASRIHEANLLQKKSSHPNRKLNHARRMSMEDYHRSMESMNVTWFDSEEDAMANI